MRDKIIFAFDEYIDSIGYVQSYKFYSSSKWLSQQVHSMKLILGRCSKPFDFIRTRIQYCLRSLQTRQPKVKLQKSNRFQGCNDLILRVYLGSTKILILKHYKLRYFGCSIRWIGFLGSDFIKGPNRFIKVFIGFRYWRFKIYKFGIKGINKVSPIRGLQLICFQTEMKLANLRDTCIILYAQAI